jgi:alcohol dehydrogenase
MGSHIKIDFQLARLPTIEFGSGRLARLPELCRQYGSHLLIITGAESFLLDPHWQALSKQLTASCCQWQIIRIAGEPSPSEIDQIVTSCRGAPIDCVLGIGGGSALDAAKAVAGLLKPGNSVMDHLEGVGPELPYRGPATPFIAVPTTAGTGSEATKNAVLSKHGHDGFKKSFRDDLLMASHAIIDPDLLATCPPQVIAANGMDAFTQLLESYVSSKAHPLTDALALSGMEKVREALLDWYEDRGDAARHREGMAYAALLSGITLAHVGLGCVHGLASPLGAFFPIPHGVACGTLLAEATRVNILAMQAREPSNPALEKYARVGHLLDGTQQDGLKSLVARLEDWTLRLRLPRLSKFGVAEADIDRIVANSRGSSMKTNPILLTDAEIADIVRARI